MNFREFRFLVGWIIGFFIIAVCLWQTGRHVGFLTPAQRVYTVKERVYYV